MNLVLGAIPILIVSYSIRANTFSTVVATPHQHNEEIIMIFLIVHGVVTPTRLFWTILHVKGLHQKKNVIA
jgi:hypothetical protein